MPLRTQLSMMFVVSRERATTAGMTHMAFDLGGSAGALLGGTMIVGGEFLGAFGVEALKDKRKGLKVAFGAMLARLFAMILKIAFAVFILAFTIFELILKIAT